MYKVKIALTVFVIFSIKKPSFLTSNSVCYWNISEDTLDLKDYYFTPSIWSYKQERGISLRPRSALTILLILAGDIETCPGPCLKYNCCSETIRKNQAVGCCSICDDKHHMKYLLSFVETPRKFIIAELSIRKLGSSSVLIIPMKIRAYGSKALQ